MLSDLSKILLGAILAIIGGFVSNAVLKLMDHRREEFVRKRQAFEVAYHELIDLLKDVNDYRLLTVNFAAKIVNNPDVLVPVEKHKEISELNYKIRHQMLKIAMPFSVYEPKHAHVIDKAQADFVGTYAVITELYNFQNILAISKIDKNLAEKSLANLMDEKLERIYGKIDSLDAEFISNKFQDFIDKKISINGRNVEDCISNVKMILFNKFVSHPN